MLSGTFIQDVPFLVVRAWAVAVIGDSGVAGPGFLLLYAFLLKSCCSVTCAAVSLVVYEAQPAAGDGDQETYGSARYRGLVRRRSGSVTADGLVQIPADNDAENDDEHFV